MNNININANNTMHQTWRTLQSENLRNEGCVHYMLCAISVLNGVRVYGHNGNPNPNPDGNIQGHFYFRGPYSITLVP